MVNTVKTQLEMPLEGGNCPAPRPFRSVARRNRARWWFAQMRQAVEIAPDWPSNIAPRPEQTHLALNRTPSV